MAQKLSLTKTIFTPLGPQARLAMQTPSLCARSAAASRALETVAAAAVRWRDAREPERRGVEPFRLAVTGRGARSTSRPSRDDNEGDRAGDCAGPARIPPSPAKAASHPNAAGAAPPG